MKIRLQTLGADAGYVEQKLGPELYSQLGGMRAIAEFRLDAVERAGRLYDEAASRAAAEPEMTAHGLLVLQRTLLVCEDLGALINALANEPDWLRFTSYAAWELDETFSALVESRLDVPELWLMPTDKAIYQEEGWTDAQRRALRRLREISARELEQEIEMVAGFWLFHRRSIKNVMHGFSLVPACFLLDPPGGGILSEQVDLIQKRPFAASLVSELDDDKQTVITTTYTVDLTAEAVAAVRKIAAGAANLLTRLAEARRFALETNHRHVIGEEFANQLGAPDREALAGILWRRDDD
ncbi:MAG: hypothetical protein JST08_00320 [Actinobacteria bacterium]|nr:hypothetical protein [Actinomycetota bacterium]